MVIMTDELQMKINGCILAIGALMLLAIYIMINFGIGR